jgi:transcriptional regulator with XRE-family HTH domain
MARFQQDADATELGRALAELRHAAGLSQAEAGARVGMTSQGWGLYEAGKRPGLFRPDVQRRLTTALGASIEDLALLVARSAGDDARTTTLSGFESPGQVYGSAPPARARQIETHQLTDDALAPWAASGVVLEFDADRWPRRDQGCVIDLVSGERRVRLYDHADADAIHVRDASTQRDRVQRIARGDVQRVCAVIARRET